jgi:two-component system OmpR family response regulator
MRILVVEDELRMAALLKRGLEEDGYAVDVATDGPEGLWYASENPYDTILLDVMLPGMDGFEVCKRLRAEGCWMPVLMLTAVDPVQERVRGLDVGADDYLTKPFSFAELEARIRALTRRVKVPRPAILEVDDLRLDPSTHQVWRGDTELDLSPKEFALLEFLMRHPGQVFGRTQIIEHVWDFEYEGISNVVEQYVSYLRRKVDQPFDKNSLETVRGVGYRLRRGQ